MMPPPKTRQLRSILCGVDLSPVSAKALRYAVALANAAGGHVTAVLAVDPMLSAAAVVAYDSRIVEAGAAHDLARFLRRTVGAAAATRIGRVVAAGKPGAVVLDNARRLRADVIVLGTNARRGARKVLFGSTTRAVLRRFRGAVLVVPPHARVAQAGWPSGSIVAAVGDGHRCAAINAAARVAEMFGSWLSLVPAAPTRNVAPRAHLILYPLPRVKRPSFAQGGAAYRFVCAAGGPVLVFPTGRWLGVRVTVTPRAA